MADVQPYLISEFKSGIQTYLQPWIRPAEAFEPLVNAYIYRGTINKRAGYTQFGGNVPGGNAIMGIMRHIQESTGDISLIIATLTNLYYYDFGTNSYLAVANPPTFTGTIRNFFNWTNWQASDGAPAYLWMVNGIDPVTNLTTQAGPPIFIANQPTITVDGAGTTIKTALDVVVYKQRLLLIRPTLSTGAVDTKQNQAIYWSAIQDPTSWRTDIAGQGGFLDAPTGDIILSTEFLRDVLVVNFTNSTWIFRFTGNASDPFRWDKINNTKSSNCPYGSEAYDERTTSIGNTGFTACDGVNVQRYDVPIIDYYETNFNQNYFSQAFSQRYDNLNQTWILYVSSQTNTTDFPLVGGIAPGSDQALVYNFLENTWATYKWTRPLTCLGIFFNPTGKTWAQMTQSWESSNVPWDSYTNQLKAPILLAGDTTGHIWYMDNGNAKTDNGTSIVPDIVTTRWNPIMAAGQKVQFTYIDIYYKIVSTDATSPISVTLNFYVDNSEAAATTRTLTLDGPAQSAFTFKRIFINLIGEFVQMEIDSLGGTSVDSYMQFLGFILWAKPSGRLTP